MLDFVHVSLWGLISILSPLAARASCRESRMTAIGVKKQCLEAGHGRYWTHCPPAALSLAWLPGWIPAEDLGLGGGSPIPFSSLSKKEERSWGHFPMATSPSHYNIPMIRKLCPKIQPCTESCIFLNFPESQENYK